LIHDTSHLLENLLLSLKHFGSKYIPFHYY